MKSTMTDQHIYSPELFGRSMSESAVNKMQVKLAAKAEAEDVR